MCVCAHVCAEVLSDTRRSLIPSQPEQQRGPWDCEVRLWAPCPQLSCDLGGRARAGQVQGGGAAAHIVVGWFVLHGGLDAVGQEAEDGPDPQQDGEAPEELAAELDPLGGCRGRGEGVGSIPGQNVLGPLVGEALREAGRGV